MGKRGNSPIHKIYYFNKYINIIILIYKIQYQIIKDIKFELIILKMNLTGREEGDKI